MASSKVQGSGDLYGLKRIFNKYLWVEYMNIYSLFIFASGIVATILGAYRIVPQIYKLLRTRIYHGLSISSHVYSLSASLLWIFYGIGVHAYITAIAGALGFIGNAQVIFLIYRYRANDALDSQYDTISIGLRCEEYE